MAKRKILAFLILFFSFSGSIFSQEEILSLREIDEIIDRPDERNFQKALVELNKYLEKNPAEFDAVQKRYKKILNSRKLYSELANELVELIKNSSEEDTEATDSRIKKLTEEILALEFNPNDRRLDIVKDTNYLVSIRQYSAIQNKTAKLVQSEKYSEALKKAAEGLEILRDNFNTEFGKEKISAEVDSIVREIKRNSGLFGGIFFRLENAFASCENAFNSGNEAAIQASVQNLKIVASEYCSLRNSILELGLQLEKKSSEIKKIAEKNRKGGKSGENEISFAHGEEYPALASGAVFGWSEIPGADHGILGVMDSVFSADVEKIKSAAVLALNRISGRFAEKSFVENFRRSKILPEKSELLKIEAIGKKSREINGFYSLLKKRDGSGNLLPCENFDISVEYLENVAFYSEAFVDEFEKIAEIKSSAENLLQPENPGGSALSGNSYILSLLDFVSQIDSVKKQINENSPKNSGWSEKYRMLLEKQNSSAGNSAAASGSFRAQNESGGIQPEDKILSWEKIGETYNEYIFALNDYCSELASGLYRRGAEFYSLAGIQYENEVSAKTAEIEKDLEGTVSDGMRMRFSRNAAQKILALEKFADGGKNALQFGLQKITNSYEENYGNLVSSVKSSIAALEKISVSLEEKLSEAKSLVSQADENIASGDKNFENARKLFRQKKFDEARNSAENAVEFYNSSLRFNYDEKFASSSRKKVENLLEEISEQQKIVIDKEVESLLVKARNEFSNDNYAEAQILLNRAQERWNVVFLDYKNDEIQNMMKVVENALNANNGREVLPSDALYRDVSQMLRSARQSFEKGKSYSKKGEKELASAQFSESLKTLEILRSLVPRNTEANKLRLEIQQFQDPEQFAVNFARRVSQAEKTAASASKDSAGNEKLIQAYSELSDLAEINPDYPGLKQAILEIEYSLGKKKRPLAPAAKKQAEQLYADSQKLFQAGNYQESFKKINQAISIDTENQNFKSFRSKVSARLKTKVYTRDINYADRYQEIVELISSNRYEMAQEIISEMWKNPANRTDNLGKLKNRVERALGQ